MRPKMKRNKESKYRITGEKAIAHNYVIIQRDQVYRGEGNVRSLIAHCNRMGHTIYTLDIITYVLEWGGSRGQSSALEIEDQRPLRRDVAPGNIHLCLAHQTESSPKGHLLELEGI